MACFPFVLLQGIAYALVPKKTRPVKNLHHALSFFVCPEGSTTAYSYVWLNFHISFMILLTVSCFFFSSALASLSPAMGGETSSG
jgi:hypothetical protein